MTPYSNFHPQYIESAELRNPGTLSFYQMNFRRKKILHPLKLFLLEPFRYAEAHNSPSLIFRPEWRLASYLAILNCTNHLQQTGIPCLNPGLKANNFEHETPPGLWCTTGTKSAAESILHPIYKPDHKNGNDTGRTLPNLRLF